MGQEKFVMLEIILVIVTLGLIFALTFLFEATAEIKRLQSEDRMQATVAEILDHKKTP